MTRTQQCLDSLPLPAWGTVDALPAEFAMFYFGPNRTTKGVVYLTELSARRCLATWQEYGNDLAGDYEHAAAERPDGSPKPASCWFKLALRHNGLYAVDVRWTERGAALLKAREYRYYSPFFWMEQGDNNRWYVTEIINVALTNQPATKNQRPLVASALGRIKRKHTMSFTQEQIDGMRKILEGGGIAAEKVSDIILQLQPICCNEAAPEMPADMPMADAPAEEKPMEYKDGVNNELKDQLKAALARLAVLEAKDKEDEKAKSEALFSQFKKEGRLRLTTETKAREVLQKYGRKGFEEMYGMVPALTDQASPAAPRSLSQPKPDTYQPSVVEIAEYQKKHNIASPAKAAAALRRDKQAK